MRATQQDDDRSAMLFVLEYLLFFAFGIVLFGVVAFLLAFYASVIWLAMQRGWALGSLLIGAQ